MSIPSVLAPTTHGGFSMTHAAQHTRDANNASEATPFVGFGAFRRVGLGEFRVLVVWFSVPTFVSLTFKMFECLRLLFFGSSAVWASVGRFWLESCGDVLGTT